MEQGFTISMGVRRERVSLLAEEEQRRGSVCAEGQWSSRGAVIQAGPSCRLA